MRGAVHLPLCPHVNTRERQLLICLPAKLISTFYVGEGRQGGYVQSVVVSAVFSRTTARVNVGVQGDARTLNSSTISSIPPHSPPTRKFCSSTFYKRHPRYPPSLLANEARVDTQRCTSRKLALGIESETGGQVLTMHIPPLSQPQPPDNTREHLEPARKPDRQQKNHPLTDAMQTHSPPYFSSQTCE